MELHQWSRGRQSKAETLRSEAKCPWYKKTYNAEVVGDDSIAQVQQALSHEGKPFAMELVNPYLADSQRPPSGEESQPALISRMKQLADVVAGLEARILCHFDSIEYRLTKMQADLDCLLNQETAVLEYQKMYLQYPSRYQKMLLHQ